MELSGKTKVFGIIGNPVTHSLSPTFQTEFLRQHQIDGVYVPFCVPDEGLSDALKGLWAAGVAGINVTIPHKEAVLPWVKADDDARCIGAANTLKWHSSGWLANNTDWLGVDLALSAIQAPSTQPVLMFGAGGTAKAVVHALSKRNVSTLYICNRNPKRAQALQEHIQQYYSNIDCHCVIWDTNASVKVAAECGTWINTTSIGLQQDDVFPFELVGRAVALDVVYKPDGNTPFCNMVRNQGLQAIDGLVMLLAQGAASFSLWHDTTAPKIEEMYRNMETRMGRDAMVLTGWEEQI